VRRRCSVADSHGGNVALPKKNLMNLQNFSGVLRMPLPRGDEGVARTIRLIRDLMDAAVADPQVNEAAINILRNASVQNFDREAKLRALYEFVSWPNFLYVEDPVGPFGPKETVRTVRTLLRVRAGDCDDYTLLLASLAGTVGIATRAVTVAADPSAPNDFSHIYPEAELSPGNWVAMDAARPGAQYGLPAQRYFRKRVWSLTDSSYRDVAGQRISSLNGYAVLGQPNPNVAAEDISAVGQSVANVIAASKGSPYGSFTTPYTPVAPPAGYGVPGYPGGVPGASLSLAGISPVWIIVGIGAIALALRETRK
jgi:transglutaminase-like putative cysteine protease